VEVRAHAGKQGIRPYPAGSGFRKGSDLVAKVNEAIVKLSQNGKLAEIAAKYNLTNALITNIGE
jgi:ABC-type amino acid transport substrate-binding protein